MNQVINRAPVSKAVRLRAALRTMREFPVDAAVAEMCKGRSEKVNDQMGQQMMPIAQFLSYIKNVKPITVQRNDLYRLNNGLAKHLDNLSLPQNTFATIDLHGVPYLVDGNHRKRSWLSQVLRTLPSHVWVTVMVVDTMEQGKHIYGCYDSKNANKTGRDGVMSFLSEAGIDTSSLHSKLVAGGKFLTVLQLMTRALRATTATKAAMQAVVNEHVDAFRSLESHQLDENQVVAAGVWAALRLYKTVPVAFHPFVRDYVEDMRRLGTKLESFADQATQQAKQAALSACVQANCGTSGQKAIAVSFSSYVRGFGYYAHSRVRAQTAGAKFKKFATQTLPGILDAEVQCVELQRQSKLENKV